MLAWLLLELLFDARWRRVCCQRSAGAAWASFSARDPCLWYIATHWSIYALRSDQVSIFSDAAKSGRPVLGELWTTLSKHLLMFNLRGDFNARHNLHFYPHVDLISAAGIAVAVPYAVGRSFKDARGRFLAIVDRGDAQRRHLHLGRRSPTGTTGPSWRHLPWRWP